MPDLVIAGLIVGWFLLLVGYLWAVGRLAR
jgi:hypothetical protein